MVCAGIRMRGYCQSETRTRTSCGAGRERDLMEYETTPEVWTNPDRSLVFSLLAHYSSLSKALLIAYVSGLPESRVEYLRMVYTSAMNSSTFCLSDRIELYSLLTMMIQEAGLVSGCAGTSTESRSPSIITVPPPPRILESSPTERFVAAWRMRRRGGAHDE